MHNYYLMHLLKDLVQLSIISSENRKNRKAFINMGISFGGFNALIPDMYSRMAKFAFLKDGLRSYQDWKISSKIADTIKSESADIIEFMDIHTDGYVYLKNHPVIQRKNKVIIRSHTPWGLLRSYHSFDELKGTDSWWTIQREYYCFQNCDGITVPSNNLKNKLIDLYNIPADKITVIPNILDTDHFRPIKQESHNRCFTILHVGRFERAKGVLTLIKAFINFARFDQECMLINIGEPRGPAFKVCVDLLKNANLLGRVTFAGIVPYKQLPVYYSKADIVIVASEVYESFSYTTAQAMACGKAVISSSIGGIPETLNNGKAGLLYDSGDSNELTERIITLFNNYDLRNKLETEARKYAVEKFSIQELKKTYLEYYERFLN